MVDILDKTLSKYINTTLLPLDILNVAHKYGNVTKAKEIIRDLKEDFEKGIDKIDSIPNNISDRLVNYAKNKKEELKESVKKLLWI